jgi:hypothetical protein
MSISGRRQPDFPALFGSEPAVAIRPFVTAVVGRAAIERIGSVRICMGAMSHPGGLKWLARLLLAPTSHARMKTVFASKYKY